MRNGRSECDWVHCVTFPKTNKKFLDRYHLPNLNNDQMNKLNKLMIPKKIESVIKRLPVKKFSGSDSRILSDLPKKS